MQRSFSNRVFGGVCGGLAAALRLKQAGLLRALFVILALASGGVFAVLYVVLWGVVPLESPLGARRRFPVLLVLVLIALAGAAWFAWANGLLNAPIADALSTLPIGLTDLIARAAPAVLVLIGLALLLRRRVPFSGIIALVLTVGVVGGIAYTAFNARAGQQLTDTQQTIDERIEDGTSLLYVRVAGLTSSIVIERNTAASVTGTFIGSRDSAVIIDRQFGENNTVTLTLNETRASGDFPLLEAVGRGALTLQLPPGVPIDLQVTSADGDVQLNLGGVSIEALTVDAVSGDLLTIMPDYDPVYPQPDALLGTLTAQNGDLTLVVPQDVAARLELDRRGSGIAPDFDSVRYDYLQGDVLQAVDFRTAATVIRYALVAGRGTIRIETQP